MKSVCCWRNRWTKTRCRSCATKWRGCRTASTPRICGSWTGEIEIAMDVMNLPPKDADVRYALRWRTAACRTLSSCYCRNPTCCCWTSRPTTWTPKRSSGWNGTWRNTTGTVVAVTHDRYFLDNVAQWILELDRGHGIPWEGNYSSWLEQKQQRLAREEKSSPRPARNRCSENWNGSAWPPERVKPRARHVSRPTSKWRRPGTKKAMDEFEIQIPPGRHLGDLVVEAQSEQRLW